jgi:hypothetical protein
MRSIIIICTHPKISSGMLKQRDQGGRGMWHAWDREESVPGFGGIARRKDSPRKTEAQMGGWDQNGSLGEWLEGKLDPFASGYGRWWAVVNTAKNPWVLAPQLAVKTKMFQAGNKFVTSPAN